MEETKLACAICQSEAIEDWIDTVGTLQCYHHICGRCISTNGSHGWGATVYRCNQCQLPANTLKRKCTVAIPNFDQKRDFNKLNETIKDITQLKDLEALRAKNLTKKINVLKNQVLTYSRKAKQLEDQGECYKEMILTISRCSDCAQVVPHQQLFLCHNDACCAEKEKAVTVEKILEQSICGSCAMTHFVEHAANVAKALPTALSIASDNLTKDLAIEIDEIFGDVWGEMVEAVTNFKDDARKNLSTQNLLSILGGSKSLEEYKKNAEKVKNVVRVVREERDNLKKNLYERLALIEAPTKFGPTTDSNESEDVVLCE